MIDTHNYVMQFALKPIITPKSLQGLMTCSRTLVSSGLITVFTLQTTIQSFHFILQHGRALAHNYWRNYRITNTLREYHELKRRVSSFLARRKYNLDR